MSWRAESTHTHTFSAFVDSTDRRVCGLCLAVYGTCLVVYVTNLIGGSPALVLCGTDRVVFVTDLVVLVTGQGVYGADLVRSGSGSGIAACGSAPQPQRFTAHLRDRGQTRSALRSPLLHVRSSSPHPHFSRFCVFLIKHNWHGTPAQRRSWRVHTSRT